MRSRHPNPVGFIAWYVFVQDVDKYNGAKAYFYADVRIFMQMLGSRPALGAIVTCCYGRIPLVMP